MCTLTLICGLELPIVAIVAAGLYGIVRLLYFLLKRRGPGFLLGMLCLLTLIVGAFYSAGKVMKEVNDLL